MKLYKFNILLIISLFTIVSLTNCKKYPEDHKLSFHTPIKRLTDDTWTLKEFLVDGCDSTNTWFLYKLPNGYINDTLFWTPNEMTIRFNDKIKEYSGKYPYHCNYLIKKKNHLYEIVPFNKFTDSEEYSMSNNKKRITLNLYESFYPTPTESRLYYLRSSNDWTVKKLTSKEFIIESKNNENKLIRIKFQK